MNNPEPSDRRLASVRLPSKEKDMEERSTPWPLLPMYYETWFTFCANMHCFCLVTNEWDVFLMSNISAIYFYSSKNRYAQLNFHASSTISENTLCIQWGRTALRNITSKESNLIYMRRLSFNCLDRNLVYLSDKAWFHYNLFCHHFWKRERMRHCP